MIDWNKTTRKDIMLISKITSRYIKILSDNPLPSYRVNPPKPDDVSMDLDACHQNQPLKLQELLESDDLNLIHDVGGIRVNLDRETGLLKNNFLPKFLVK